MPHDHLMAYYGHCDPMVIAIHFIVFYLMVRRHNRVNTRDLTVRYQHLVDQPQEYSKKL